MKAKLLPLFLLAALPAAALAATPPNTLVVVQSLDDIVSLDPAEANELSSIQTVPSLYQRLVQADRDDPAKVAPVLAESWRGDAAAKTLTVKLRPQAAFASGNPLTADDVIFSYSRAVKMNKSPAFILNVLGWQPDNIDAQLKKIDEHTVQLRWTADVSPAVALNILSTPIASIVDSKAALANVKDGDFGNAWLKMHSAGSGPFKMRVYQPHQAIVLDADPTTPGDKPQLKNIIIKNVPDPATRRLLLQQGDADIARELGADQTDTLKNQPGVKVLEIPSAEQNYLVFNTGNGANPLLNNPAFWEAARYLVDYQGITKDSAEGPILRAPELPAGRAAGRAGDQPVQLRSGQGESHPGQGGHHPRRLYAGRGEQTAVHHHRAGAAGQLRRRRREDRAAAGRGQPGLLARARQTASGGDPAVDPGLLRRPLQRQRLRLQRRQEQHGGRAERLADPAVE